MSIPPAVLARAKALKALAESTDNPHEAELAAVRLAEYLDKHRLDEARLEDDVAPFGRVRYALTQHRYLRPSLSLLGVVAEHYGVVVLTPRTGNSKNPGLVGTATDIEMVVLMFESLIVQRDRACIAAVVPPGRGVVTFRNSFCYGYATRIQARLEELRRRQRADAVATGDGKAVALFDRAAAVLRFLEEQAGKAIGHSNRNKPRLDGEGLVQGDHAARRADLGQTRVANDDAGPRAIGTGA